MDGEITGTLIVLAIIVSFMIYALISRSRMSPEEKERIHKELVENLQQGNGKYNFTISEDGKMKCPHCGAQIQPQMVQRRWSPISGFLTNKVDRVCPNCKGRF